MNGKKHILQVLFLLVFFLLNGIFIGQGENMFNLSKKTDSYSLLENKNTDAVQYSNQEKPDITFISVADIEHVWFGSRPVKRLFYVKKNFRYIFQNNHPPLKERNYDLLKDIIPLFHKKYNILLRVLII